MGIKAQSAAKTKKSPETEATYLNIGKTKVKLTNQDKPYWPEEGYSKGDLIQYYNEISDFILPYIKQRAHTLHRFPNGIESDGFYQKDVDTLITPKWVQIEKVYSPSTEEHVDYLVCDGKAALIYMANLGCIEINPWNSRVEEPDHPDWMVIDLDPVQTDFKTVVEVALATKKLFDELETESYCKTSGSRGMHIYVPLGAHYQYEEVRECAKLIAEQLHERLSGFTSIIRDPDKRQKKVYIDYLQNSRGQTLAAPYSVRPKPGATVSTPLEWDEVTPKLDPTQFTMKTIHKRLEKVGDLWKPVLAKKGADITGIIRRLRKADEVDKE